MFSFYCIRSPGASTGALVAALYAEQNRNIDKVFLLAPTFCLKNLLATFVQT
jgi:alpha-beta hydrolase superfamily lysophospholipase